MAIAQMTKIKLIGLTYHEEKILNALNKSECVELSTTESIADTFTVPCDELDDLNNKFNRINKAIEFYNEQLEKGKKESYYPKDNVYLRNFFISYDNFMSTEKKESEYFKIIDESESFQERLVSLRAEKIKLGNEISQLELYVDFKEKFSDVKACSNNFSVLFGIIKKDSLPIIDEFKRENELFDYRIFTNSQNCIAIFVCYSDLLDKTVKMLNEQGFLKCPFDYDCTASERIEIVKNDIRTIIDEENTISKNICLKVDNIGKLKILSDYYKFIIEKRTDAENFRHTSKTFYLEGYLPKGSEITVKEEINKISDAVFIDFSEPTENDNPPTLTVNNSVVKQSEFVTDMYSVPNYREIDPNKVVFLFFMVFMGVIMADIGYGFLMSVIGLCLALRIKVDNGSRRLWWVISFGGIFAMVFGFLFNSFFGIQILPFRILPNPVPDENGTDGLMIILLLCLSLGILHIAVAYLFKGLNCIKQKDVVGAIFDGFIWVFFFIGFVFAAFNFLLEYLSPNSFDALNPSVKNFFDKMTVPGLITVIAAVVLATLMAGRKEKGFGKFSKGFGTVYGLINIMSDILSYARLFGLMLSGMIIASTFNNIGSGLFTSGGIGYVFGPIVIGLGHTFNIAMGVLGAYIHDSRLQYIEFFGKFYTGDGEKFTPLGSEKNFIYLTK